MTANPKTPRVDPKGLQFESLKGKLARRPSPAPDEGQHPAQLEQTPPEPAPPTRSEQPGAAAEQPAPSSSVTPAPATGQRSGPTGAAAGEKRARPPVGEAQPARRRVAFTLPVDLRDALAKRARDTSQAEVIFDAIETHLDDIPDLLSEAGSAPAGKLFKRTRREPQQHRVPTTIWMSVQNVSHIDALAAAHKAATRTQLLEVVLRRYLQRAQ